MSGLELHYIDSVFVLLIVGRCVSARSWRLTYIYPAAGTSTTPLELPPAATTSTSTSSLVALALGIPTATRDSSAPSGVSTAPFSASPPRCILSGHASPPAACRAFTSPQCQTHGPSARHIFSRSHLRLLRGSTTR